MGVSSAIWIGNDTAECSILHDVDTVKHYGILLSTLSNAVTGSMVYAGPPSKWVWQCRLVCLWTWRPKTDHKQNLDVWVPRYQQVQRLDVNRCWYIKPCTVNVMSYLTKEATDRQRWESPIYIRGGTRTNTGRQWYRGFMGLWSLFQCLINAGYSRHSANNW